MTNRIKYIIRKIEAQGNNNKFVKLDLELYGLAMVEEERLLRYGTIIISKYDYLIYQYRVGDIVTLGVDVVEKSAAAPLNG